MSESSDVQKSVERMQIHMELRGLRPNTTYTFANCARRFLAYVGKPPTAVTTEDVEGFLRVGVSSAGFASPHRIPACPITPITSTTPYARARATCDRSNDGCRRPNATRQGPVERAPFSACVDREVPTGRAKDPWGVQQGKARPVRGPTRDAKDRFSARH
jgi:hypothetical protein